MRTKTKLAQSVLAGVRMNVRRRGASVSVGGRVSTLIFPKRGTRTTLGIPSSGLSDSTTTHPHQTHGKGPQPAHPAEAPTVSPPPKGKAWRGSLWAIAPVVIMILLGRSLAVAAIEGSPISTDPFSIQSPPPDHRGTDRQPLVIDKTIEALQRDAADQAEHATNEHIMMVATVALTVVTVFLWLVNMALVRDSRRVSTQQAKDTQSAISESKRSADAMQDVAKATKDNAALMSGMIAKQMRAYLSVEFGTAVYQDARLRFEAMPLLTNHGLTPARNVCYRVLAGIYDGSHLGLEFPIIGDLIVNDVGIAPRQSFTIRGLVSNRLPEADVPLIMEGNTRRLFTWGKVTYDDVYGGSWTTNFCISYWFNKVGNDVKVFGNFYPTFNNAT